MKEWQAIAIAYGVLLALSETSAAPLASLMAWGLAVTYFLDANVTRGKLLSRLFPSGAAAQPAAQQTAAQAQAQIAQRQAVAGQPFSNVPPGLNLDPGSPNVVQP